MRLQGNPVDKPLQHTATLKDEGSLEPFMRIVLAMLGVLNLLHGCVHWVAPESGARNPQRGRQASCRRDSEDYVEESDQLRTRTSQGFHSCVRARTGRY